MINKILLSLIAVLCLDATVTAQNKQVSGTVTDPAGAPVVGATVLVEGTMIGSTTDASGHFSLNAPEDAKLNISFKWDDSIILDRLSEMAQWQQEVSMGLRSKTEYRMHFFGEDEETATRAVQAIQQETGASDILKGVIDNGDG